MNLDYLDGIEDNETSSNESEELLRMLASYPEPANVDIADIESVHDSEEMGNIFKKIGNAVKKVADVQKKIIRKSIDIQKDIVKKTVQAPAKKIAEFAKTKGVHFINRFTNPGTILLRNGFLLGVKLNIFNIGGRMRYAYLSDAEAQARGIDLGVLAHVRKIKDKAEKIYYDAGGNKSNFRKAVLKGRGNKKHNPVPLSGLGGFDDAIYADAEEYSILEGDIQGLDGLGEVATGAAIVAALGVLKAVASTFKSVKGLFKKKGSAEEASFQSETDNATSVEDAKKETISEKDDEVRTDDSPVLSTSSDTDYKFLLDEASSPPNAANTSRQTAPNTTTQNTQNNNGATNQTKDTASGDTSSGTTVPDIYTAPGGNTTDVVKKTQDGAADQPKDNTGFFKTTTNWVKDNPGKSLLIAGVVAGGGYMVLRAIKGNKAGSGESLSGFLTNKTRKYTKKKKGKKVKRASSVRQAQSAREKVIFKNLL
jgi:hypothetical protein